MDSKSKTPKYWYQSTRRGMKNDQTICPAPGLKRKPWIGNILSNVKNNANISANAILMDEQKHCDKNKMSPLITPHDSWELFAPRYGSYTVQ